MSETRGTLKEKEPHPAAQRALEYVEINMTPLIRESLASCAIESNRLAEVCLETWRRIDEGEPVSDRYILGLAWFIKTMEDSND